MVKDQAHTCAVLCCSMLCYAVQCNALLSSYGLSNNVLQVSHGTREEGPCLEYVSPRPHHLLAAHQGGQEEEGRGRGANSEEDHQAMGRSLGQSQRSGWGRHSCLQEGKQCSNLTPNRHIKPHQVWSHVERALCLPGNVSDMQACTHFYMAQAMCITALAIWCVCLPGTASEMQACTHFYMAQAMCIIALAVWYFCKKQVDLHKWCSPVALN